MKQTEPALRKIDTERDAAAMAEIFESGGIFPLVVTGASMSPYLRDRVDTVHLRKPDTLYVGQILFYRRHSGEFILHRLRQVRSDGSLLMNGDAQHWCEIIRREQVLAAVLAVTHKNGKMRRETAVGAVLWRVLWYPTRPLRPLLRRIWSFAGRLLPWGRR